MQNGLSLPASTRHQPYIRNPRGPNSSSSFSCRVEGRDRVESARLLPSIGTNTSFTASLPSSATLSFATPSTSSLLRYFIVRHSVCLFHCSSSLHRYLICPTPSTSFLLRCPTVRHPLYLFHCSSSHPHYLIPRHSFCLFSRPLPYISPPPLPLPSLPSVLRLVSSTRHSLHLFHQLYLIHTRSG
jgi:hypothetical protein